MEWCSSLFAMTVSVFQSCTHSSVSSKWIQLFKKSSVSLFYIFLKWNCVTGCMWSWNPPNLQPCLPQYLQSSSVNVIPWFPYDHVPVLAGLRSSSKSSVASWTENVIQYQSGRCSSLRFAHISGNAWNEHLLRDHLACDCELSLDLFAPLSVRYPWQRACSRENWNVSGSLAIFWICVHHHALQNQIWQEHRFFSGLFLSWTQKINSCYTIHQKITKWRCGDLP